MSLLNRPLQPSLLMITLLILGVFSLQPAAAFPCIDQDEWFCHPDPQFSLPPEVGSCAQNCETTTYSIPGPGDDVETPPVWLVWCQFDEPILVALPLLADSEDGCPSGSTSADTFPAIRLVPQTGVASADGISVVTLTSGGCPVSMQAQVYGMGFTGQDEYVPCVQRE